MLSKRKLLNSVSDSKGPPVLVDLRCFLDELHGLGLTSIHARLELDDNVMHSKDFASR